MPHAWLGKQAGIGTDKQLSKYEGAMRTISRILQIGRGWRTNSWNDVEETYRYWSEKVRYRLYQMPDGALDHVR